MEDKKNNKLSKISKVKVEEQSDSLVEDSAQLPVVVNKKIRVLAKKPKEIDEKNGDDKENVRILKIVPVKNIVLFPHNVLPFTAGKEWTNESVDRAIRIGGKIGILAQKSSEVESATPNDLFEVGTEAKVLKIMKFPDNSYGAVVQGVRRFRVLNYVNSEIDHLSAEIEYLDSAKPSEEGSESIEVIALGKAMKQLVQKAISLSPNIPNEANLFIENVQEPDYLANLIIPYLSIDFKGKQNLLETEDVEERLKVIHSLLVREIEVLEISQKINSDVKSEMGKQQRKYFLREQLKLLQKELGELDGRSSSSSSSDPVDLNEKIQNSKMSEETKEVALREVERMGMMQPGSPEYMVSHTYITWLLDIPWGTFSESEINLKEAQKILDKDHYGLAKVKKRILEFLAVCALKNSLKGPILLFVGPPGVGKTSLGKSIAKALGRKFTRIALGGVRDEAEIRGHRRTYIGSMPGKIADAFKKAGTMNPVILFDEIDKLASDGRGDPSSALLEVLDPEQNNVFMDHYLNVPLDLSKVFFIATANNLSSIPAPLRDRMEIVDLSSYTLEEKEHIAFDHLLPQVIDDHGMTDLVNLKMSKETMRSLIQLYTREAGVRQLKRELSGVIRGIARECVDAGMTHKASEDSQNEKAQPLLKEINVETLRKLIGVSPFSDKKRPESLPIGVATGLAWTPNGGDVLYIETASSAPGTGKFGLTGQLGDVMKESVQTAFAYIRSNARQCGIQSKDVIKKDLHVHFPEGAVKKDGPSAGVATFLGIVSQFTGKPIASDLAMTGEISLRGDVLPVGGIKEKLLAAHRYGIKQVLIPSENEHDLEEIPEEVLKEMKVVPVSNLDEVLSIAFKKNKKVQLKNANVKVTHTKKAGRSLNVRSSHK
ncbi:endopeptidase La [Silvanigrella paludirubra]|uniref:Lon protease n=1 Tax=Silvanigrella paludirubra TaxID=2499159 RepID=A0A6N6VY13_9BACT|nr:endopeptidase La [Silvanigrella paludirubra]KAB8040949.1 endopeptidase La [Silvanigrella paludirubra]